MNAQAISILKKTFMLLLMYAFVRVGVSNVHFISRELYRAIVHVSSINLL